MYNLSQEAINLTVACARPLKRNQQPQPLLLEREKLLVKPFKHGISTRQHTHVSLFIVEEPDQDEDDDL